MRRSHAAALSTCLSALLGSACVGDEEPDRDDGEAPPELPFEYETPHLEIHSDVQRCEGDFARWEGFIDFMGGQLGTELSAPITLYVWDDENFGGQVYCGSSSSCFEISTARLYTRVTSVEHELVHAAASHLRNRDAFFHEGLAEALSGPTTFGVHAPSFPVSDSSLVDYASAGHFVRWLMERDGVARLLGYMDTAGKIADFESAYGGTLAVIVAAYFNGASSDYAALHEYPAPMLMSSAEMQWSGELEFSCTRDDVRGSAQGLVAIRQLELPSSGTYAFWTSTGGAIHGRRLSLPSGNDETAFSSNFELPPGQIAAIPLSAGRYELRITAPPSFDTGTVMVWQHVGTTPTYPGALP